MERNGWWIAVCCALAVASACKKQDQAPPAAPPAADAAPAADAPAATDAGAPPAADTATGARPATPPAGGGMQLLAAWMGGNAAAAPAPPKPLLPLDLIRSTGRRLLAHAEESPLDAALDAAELAGLLAQKEAPAARTPAVAPAAPVAAPPYDPADPCAALVPLLWSCLQSEIGEAPPADEQARAIEECRARLATWDPARQDRLRACVAAPDCPARLACAAEVDDDDADGDQPPPPSTPLGPPPPDADFCTKLAYRTSACFDVPVPAEVVHSQIEDCRRDQNSIPAEVRRQWETCFDRPCHELFECMAAVNVDHGAGSGSVDTSAPDPEQLAALPPPTRRFCGEFAAKIDACWEAFGGAPNTAGDPATAAMTAGLRAEMRTSIENACLQSAIVAPEQFPALFGAFRPCFAAPCDRFVDCLTNAAATAGATGTAP